MGALESPGQELSGNGCKKYIGWGLRSLDLNKLGDVFCPMSLFPTYILTISQDLDIH
jgi:hypothetical protein